VAADPPVYGNWGTDLFNRSLADTEAAAEEKKARALADADVQRQRASEEGGGGDAGYVLLPASEALSQAQVGDEDSDYVWVDPTELPERQNIFDKAGAYLEQLRQNREQNQGQKRRRKHEQELLDDLNRPVENAAKVLADIKARRVQKQAMTPTQKQRQQEMLAKRRAQTTMLTGKPPRTLAPRQQLPEL